jgi:hypothetical protein
MDPPSVWMDPPYSKAEVVSNSVCNQLICTFSALGRPIELYYDFLSFFYTIIIEPHSL